MDRKILSLGIRFPYPLPANRIEYNPIPEHGEALALSIGNGKINLSIFMESVLSNVLMVLFCCNWAQSGFRPVVPLGGLPGG